MITQVHRVYDKRPDVFKFVVISDDFRESLAELMGTSLIPTYETTLFGDDGQRYKVVGRHIQHTDHPLIWEVTLAVLPLRESETVEGERQWLERVAKLGDMRARPEDVATIVEYAHA